MHLKKQLVVLILFAFALPLTVSAGDSGGLGIKAGANFTKNGFIAGDTKFQPGMTFGLTYEKRAIKVFGFEIGAHYNWKRSKSTDFVVDSISFENFTTGFHYVEVPVVFKFYIFEWFNVNAGAYVSYLIAAKAEGVDNFGVSNIWNLISDGDFRDENGDAFLNRLDFGIHFGAEFVTRSGFGFGARYSQGFGDVTNNSFEWSTSMLKPDSDRVKTSSIFAYLFYEF